MDEIAKERLKQFWSKTWLYWVIALDLSVIGAVVGAILHINIFKGLLFLFALVVFIRFVVFMPKAKKT